MSAFELHPQLAADSLSVTDLQLCTLRLVNDSNYPWLLLVPMQPGLTDLTDLAEQDALTLMKEINMAAGALKALGGWDKLNVASLGNQVPQLHVHIIARQKDDAAWPKPVWGVAAPRAYQPEQASSIVTELRQSLP